MTTTDTYDRKPIMKPLPYREATDIRGRHLDDLPLDQLCAPVSASTQPREHTIGKDGEEMTEVQSRRIQRQRVACFRQSRK